ncbi:protein disulfide isomerase-like 5-4 isoform X1 [Salvia splendens]|uniref:protein disulfide isomerase-like 5-4 isoform X1 n=2 Tax=Salvia splendens TaxID=180675 RepID=UPI001C256321|nr:protein disulfide isomerase-like 5-4 isoform X1 [Salvia splendens]
MFSTSKIKSVDFYRKIPRDLTEASLSGAGLSILAAFSMIFLFGMEFNDYMRVSTSTSIVVDKSSDADFLKISFNMSFPALSCEFASVDVSDVLGTNRLNITKTIRKYSIDSRLNPTGLEFHSGPVTKAVKHDEETDEEHGEGSVLLNGLNFDRISHKHAVLVVNFYAPWCAWSNRLKPSWEKAAKIIRERYDPEIDGRILMGKVDCTEAADLCKRNHIQGYPSIRIFRKGTDVREDHGHHEHESYYGDRDTDSLVKMVEDIVAPISLQSQGASNNIATEIKDDAKRPAPSAGGCRIEGFVRVKKVPGNLIISAHSVSHSFEASQMNMSHVISQFSFGKKITPRVMSDFKRLLPHFGGSHDRLNGLSYITNPSDSNANVTIEHYLQLVKIEVMTKSYRLVEEYEYTAHSSLIHSPQVPVAKFHFEPSPMQVLITENTKSFSHFITNVCAIIGGVFTVAGILDSVLRNTIRMVKKIELGKNF